MLIADETERFELTPPPDEPAETESHLVDAVFHPDPAPHPDEDVEAVRSRQMRLLLKPRGLAAAAAAGQKAAVSTQPSPTVFAEAPESGLIERSSALLPPLVIMIACAAILALSWRVGYMQGRNDLHASASNLGAPAKKASVVKTAQLGFEETGFEEALAAEPEPEPEIEPPPVLEPQVVAEKEPTPETQPVTEDAGAAEKPSPVRQAAAMTTAGALYLQVSASSEEAAATALERKLDEQGFAASTIASGDGIFRVVLGPFLDRDAAQVPAQQLRGLGYQPFPKSF